MNTLNKVIHTLEAMIAAHAQMLDLAKEKRNILVEGNIEGLQSLMLLEKKCADEIGELEQRRKEEVQAWMIQSGHPGHSFTLEELINVQNDAGAKSALHSIANQLRAQIQEIVELNEINQQLIQASISYIQYSIGLFVRNEPAVGYGPNATKRYANLLDAKI